MPDYHVTQQEDQIVLTFDVGQWLLDTAEAVADGIGEPAVAAALAWLESKDIPTQLTFMIPIVTLPKPTEEPAELEPQFVLDEITQAINQADANLGKNNFGIASGQVETSLIMRQANGEQIRAQISFEIAPKPIY